MCIVFLRVWMVIRVLPISRRKKQGTYRPLYGKGRIIPPDTALRNGIIILRHLIEKSAHSGSSEIKPSANPFRDLQQSAFLEIKPCQTICNTAEIRDVNRQDTPTPCLRCS